MAAFQSQKEVVCRGTAHYSVVDVALAPLWGGDHISTGGAARPGSIRMEILKGPVDTVSVDILMGMDVNSQFYPAFLYEEMR